MIEFQMMTNAVFFGAVPALIALYMLKLNRRNKKIPSVHFIKDLISDNKGSSLFKKLTSNMLLFLEVLFLAILTLALMNPGRPGQSFLNKKMILLIDNSITMSSREADGSLRLESAIDMAVETIYRNPNSTIAAIEFSSIPKLLFDSETSREEAARQIRAVSPTHLSCDYKSAIALAEGLSSEGSFPELHIFSDFCTWNGGRAALNDKIGVVFHPIGALGRNIGVSALEISEEAEGGSTSYDIFLTVKNYCDYEVSIPCSVFIDGSRASSSVLTIAAGAAESKIIKKYGAMPAAVSAEIITNDILAADDKRVWASSGRKSFRALVMSEKPYFYSAALEAAGGVIVEALEANIPKAIYREREYDLAVIDDSAEALLLNKYRCRNFIVIDPPEGFMGVNYGPEETGGTVRTPEFPFAYLRLMDLSDLYVHKMKKAVLNRNFSNTVYSASACPLFSTVFNENLKAFTVFFDPRSSNFPLKISFPIFFNNVINIVKTAMTTGDNFVIDRPNFFSASKFKDFKKGSTAVIKYASKEMCGENGRFTIADQYFNAAASDGAPLLKAPRFYMAGLYRVFETGNESGAAEPVFEFYVNPPASRNLNVKPQAVKARNDNKLKAGEEFFESSHVSYAAPLILLAAVIILLDWIYQNYRTFYKKEAGL